MSFYGNHPVLLISIITATIIIGIVVFNVLYIKYSGQPVPIPETPRNVQTIGSGQPLDPTQILGG